MVRIETVETLASVDPGDWESLARGKSLYATWPWYRMLEGQPGFEPRYLLARASDGGLRAALPAYRTLGGGNERYYPDYLFGGLLKEDLARRDAWLPGFSGGSSAAYLTHLLTDGSDEGSDAAAALVDAFFGLAEDEASAAWIFYVTPEDARTLAGLVPEDVVCLYGAADLALSIRWRSFDEYLASASRRVRRDLATFGKSGGSIVVTTLEEAGTSLAPLLASSLTKLVKATSVDDAERILLQHAALLSPWSRVFVCMSAGRPIGFALFFELENILYARLVGFDYAKAVNGEYFALLFYAPIRDALERGIERIHFGIGAHEPKLARGAEPRPLWCFLRHPQINLRAHLDGMESWNMSCADAFCEQYATLLRGEARTTWLRLAHEHLDWDWLG